MGYGVLSPPARRHRHFSVAHAMMIIKLTVARDIVALRRLSL